MAAVDTATRAQLHQVALDFQGGFRAQLGSPQTTLIEGSITPGGGAWLGGQWMTPMVVRKPAVRLLQELGVPFEDEGPFVVVKHAALFTSTVLSRVLAEHRAHECNRRRGPHRAPQRPQTRDAARRGRHHELDAPRAQPRHAVVHGPVVSTTGHDGPIGAFSAKRLVSVGLLEELGNMRGLDMSRAEHAIVNGACKLAPGLLMTAACALYT